ncbi:MAG TPA: GDP-mannose 4,6-dehydratase [Thermoanaerobaculia bacterium]|nr:GDP-mannose 4,6-dehydratase [Thermoanaerobaculia bacterium]
MRVLVTGISGFVGRRLALHLRERGDTVAGLFLDERPEGVEVAGVELHEADLLDAPALERVIAATAPEAIVNLAGLSHVGESWKRMSDYFRVNVLGTENLLRAARGARVVLASSAEVYGAVPAERQPICEDEVVDPHTPYALTKAAAERLAFAAGAVVARSFNLVGPGQAASFALPAFAHQLAAIARGEQPAVLKVGNLSARRDFVHVDDGAAAYRVLAEKGRPGEVYNLASGNAPSIGEALDRLMAISGVKAKVEPDPERMRPVDLPLLQGDNRRLRALGWQPRRTLDDALADLWNMVRITGR